MKPRRDLFDKIKGIIFDIDGVLLDSMEIWTGLGARYLTRIGIAPEDGLADILFSMTMEEGAAYLKKHYSIARPADRILSDLQDMLRDYYYDEVKARQGALRLLQDLKHKGLQMTAATSSPRSHIEKALERNGLSPYLDRIFTCSEVGYGKHNPQIYDAATAYMGLKAEEVCVFEDSLYALRTAADAGYHTVGVCDIKGEPDQKGLEEAAELYVLDYIELLSELT